MSNQNDKTIPSEGYDACESKKETVTCNISHKEEIYTSIMDGYFACKKCGKHIPMMLYGTHLSSHS